MPFLTLRDLILPPPLPALIAIAFAASAASIARYKPAAFIIVIALLAALVNALAMAHLASPLVLRILTALFIAAGLLGTCGYQPRSPGAAITRLIGACPLLDRSTKIERAALAAIAATILLLTLAACGPVTDPDSLDYHLGVPLDWLRHSGITFQPHWLHARLTGLGEALNMLGLAAGTDCLGAILQVGGLIAVMAALAATAKTNQDRIFALLLALPPALLPLTTSQKPQLLPAAAIAIAMILALSAASGFDFALIFGCVAFAAACKYSFAISGAAVAAVALLQAHKKKKLLTATAWAALAFAVFTMPVLARNWHLYGDPVSPFLETDPELTQFAEYLGNVGGPHTLSGILHFLPHILLPIGPGGIQTFIGLGIVAIFLASKRSATLLAAAAAVLLFTLWKGQMSPRYLLEAYFWCAAGAIAAPWSKLKAVLFYGLTAQTFGVAAMALVAAIILFPGALTPGLRETVMRRSTFGYREARWMDRIAPPGATIMSDNRAYALYPRPFIVPACDSCFRDALVFAEYPMEGKLPEGCHSTLIAGPETFPYATRTPVFTSSSYQAVALKVNCH